MENYVEVQFEELDKTVLYRGNSYIRKNLSDSLEITKQHIKIIFSRSKKIKYREILESENSLIRYQLQKALCFYLITQGTFPEVRRVLIFDGLEIHDVSDMLFVKNMEGCNLDICLTPDIASTIFKDERYSKNFYVAITYMIKAQIDAFSNDCFRAAWSGVNSIFNCLKRLSELDNGIRESDLLNRLERLIQSLEMKEAIHEIEDLSEDFYKKLDWYNYTQKYGDEIEPNKIKDTLMLRYLVKHYKIKNKEDKKEKQLFEKAKKYSNKNVTDYNSRLCMLVCKYCYMLRNRMFHGVKAYPVFIVSEKAELTVERKLTRVMLTTMCDLITKMVIDSRGGA